MLNSVQLGPSGLRVSELCLGTMNFGIPGRGHQGDWTLTEEEAKPIFKSAIDHGLYYFDCADVYGLGASEEVEGLGAKKIQSLLRHFGGRKGIEHASIDELRAVPGIGISMAKKIQNHFEN